MNSPLSAPHRPRHYKALDSWRGICALMVALYHFPIGGWLDGSAFIVNSRLFVDFFFVLSGFVIAANYLTRLDTAQQVGKFMWLRIGRLYPLHIFVFLLFVGVELAQAGVGLATSGNIGSAFAAPKGVDSVLQNALLINGLNTTNDLTWNIPSWSISCELAAYFAFALITLRAGKLRWCMYAVTILASMIILWRFNAGEFLATFDFGIFRCFAGFFTGVFVWRLLTSVETRGFAREISVPVATFFELLMVAGVGLFVSMGANDALTFAAPLIFGLAVFVFAFDRGMVSRLLQRPVFTLLGLLSYSTYLVHSFIIERMANVAAALSKLTGTSYIGTNAKAEFIFILPGLPQELLSLIFLLIVIGASWLTYHFVEVPARDWFRARSGKARSNPAMATGL